MDSNKQLQVRFYRSATGNEPVREWLLDLKVDDRKIVGSDLKTVEYGWPLGMPLCRNIRKGLWEVRCKLTGSNNIARVLFCTSSNHLVLLHGFVKKTQQTPNDDIDLALNRMKELSHE
jgi:phage-related protein